MLKDYFEVPNKPAIKSGNVLSCDFTDHETFIPQPLDFTRNTLATYVDCNGLIKMSGISETNLVTNGDFATDANWSKGAGWTISGGAANASSATSDLYQENVIEIGKYYQVTFTISNYVGGSIRIELANNSFAGTERSANGTYTEILLSGSTTVLFDARTSFTGSIDNVLIKEVDLNTPRIDYLTEIGKAKELQKPSLLLEPQSTNIVEYSEDIDQWAKQINGTGVLPVVTNNYTISPDGTKNASRVQLDIGNGTTSNDFSQVAVSLGSLVGDFTNSVYIKSNNSNDYNVVLTKPTGSFENKIITSEWQRFTATSLSATNVSIRVRLRGDEGTSKNADISVWGAQTEQLAYPTSYIPTTGSTVTRNAESCNNAGQLGVFNDTEGVLYAEMAALADDLTFRSISINDNTSNEAVVIRFRTNTNRINGLIRDGGSAVNNLNFDVTDITDFHKVAYKFKTGECALYIDGTQVATGTSTFTLSPLTNLNFDNGVGDFFYGKVREVKAFRRALTDSELTELTNNIT